MGICCAKIPQNALFVGGCQGRIFPTPPHPACTHPPTHPLWDIPSGCCFFTGPWTVTRSSLRMLRRGAAFCRSLRPVLLLVSFPRSPSPVVGVPGLGWMWQNVPFAHQRRPAVGVMGTCWLLGVVQLFLLYTHLRPQATPLNWAKFSFGLLANQKFSLAPLAPMSSDQKVSLAPSTGGLDARPPPKRSPCQPPSAGPFCLVVFILHVAAWIGYG